MNDTKRFITLGIGFCLATAAGSSAALDRVGERKDHSLDTNATNRAVVSSATATEIARLAFPGPSGSGRNPRGG